MIFFHHSARTICVKMPNFPEGRCQAAGASLFLSIGAGELGANIDAGLGFIWRISVKS
jgi:hypothetical protein